MAENNWQNKYLENSDINYGASDYETYRASFVRLLQEKYPENFNDYIDNSEIIMLISSLAYLGENLNYVVEMNTRDNFPATTERLQSLLNFARMINYPVRRNHCANGLVKIVQLETDEDLYDAFGNSIRNKPIKWNDISNTYWYEQLMVILNSVFIASNPFGIPVDKQSIEDETYNLYSLNTTNKNSMTYPYNCMVNGSTMQFEIVNPEIVNNKLYEHYPDLNNYFNIIYKNDGSGYDSVNNGFFLWFKQGTLGKQDENITEKDAYYSIDVSTANINDTDIWVEELNLDGTIKNVWSQVDSIHNLTYSNLNPGDNKIFQTITTISDTVTIKFGDGLTGEIPYGLFRVYYRTSNGLTYSINPKDMTNIKITIPYRDASYKSDQVFNLTVTFSLQEVVKNSIPSLTISDIQDSLPKVTYTQNRMVTEKDYNYYPLSYSNTIKKVIAENRIYSGVIDDMIDNNQSNKVQNTNIIIDDGILYKEDVISTISVPVPNLMTSLDMIDTYIVPITENNQFEDFWYDKFNQKSEVYYNDNQVITITEVNGNYSTGILTMPDGVPFPRDLGVGSMIKLYQRTDDEQKINESWYSVMAWYPDGEGDDIAAGTIILNKPLEINVSWCLEKVYLPFRKQFGADVIENMTNVINQITTLNVMGTSITKFGLKYDYTVATNPNESPWRLIDGNNLSDSDSSFDIDASQGMDNSWLIWVEWTPTAWIIKYRTIHYVFSSVNNIKFPKIMTEKVSNTISNNVEYDFIKFLKINERDSITHQGYPTDYKVPILQNEYHDDGSLNQDIIDIEFQRDNSTDAIDNPDVFNDMIRIVSEPDIDNNNFVFFRRDESSYGYYVWRFIDKSLINIVQSGVSDDAPDGIYYIIDGNTFIMLKNGNQSNVDNEYKMFIGRVGLYAQYKHFTTDYIKTDPVPSAFIEMYVLTQLFFKEVMNWKADPNRTLETFPKYPTEYELMKQFESLEDNKMLTDEMIWRPLKFKLLFGKEADEKLRAEIKVTKRPTSLVADNIIRQRVLMHMENFFDDAKWLNAKEFNYTELASYIYQNMSGDLTNCVIVPLYEPYRFGKLYQIRFDEYEIPLNVATLENIKVIPYISDDNIRIGK